MHEGLTYFRDDWSATQLPSPMCHLAWIYEYRLVEYSGLIYEDACCAHLDAVLVGDPLKS